MLIDMHNHTRRSSPCSLLTAEELIETARARGLDAICVTEHLVMEGAEHARQLGRQLGFPVFRGIEARTDLGDMLVYGHEQDLPEGIALEELCRRVHATGGVVFVAHPYHTKGGANLYASLRACGLDLDADWDKVPALRQLDGVEVANGQVNDGDNHKAQILADCLSRPGIGGSDAHSVPMVARAATRFPGPIRSEADLVAALKAGDYEAVRLRHA